MQPSREKEALFEYGQGYREGYGEGVKEGVELGKTAAKVALLACFPPNTNLTPEVQMFLSDL